ncbi:MAG TPA: protein translocase subunit SecF [Polyangiaceae bacterium]|nr:protein translocase subunit SecF [Polyangiaceae bacterium]
MELFKHGKIYDFMAIRAYWITFSLLMAGISLFSATVWPLPTYGTDFKGGTEVEVAFSKSVDAATIRSAVHRVGFAAPDVVSVTDPANPNRFLVRVQETSNLDEHKRDSLQKALCYAANDEAVDPGCAGRQHATEVKFSPGGDKITARYDQEPDLEGVATAVHSVAGVELRPGGRNPQVVSQRDHKVEIQLKSKGDQLMDGLRRELGADVVPENPLRVEWVGPKAGKQLRDAAVKSVAIAIVFIMAYVAFRFDLRFAPGGVVALVHDALVVVGVFVLFKREITLSTIAAVLTIVGYSINDTVVVYDRIRENLGKHRGKTFAQIINLSVSETLSRTLLTSGATLLSFLAFFIWGTGVIKDFALALLVGIVAGTYSSIYVAAPFTEWIDKRFFGGNASGGARRKAGTTRAQGKKAAAVV